VTRRTNPRGATLFGGVALLGSLLTLGCGGGGGSSDGGGGPSGPRQVAIAFAAQVNGAPFACGQTSAGIGSSGATIEPSDLRFYVSNVRLVDADGNEMPLELDQDGVWQIEDLALLDFEDGTGRCSLQGTPATNTTVRGSVDGAAAVGVRFTVGVPFDRNHGDAATAPAPLNLSALFWNWNAGYKFFVWDSVVLETSREFRMHVGSTVCDGDGRGNVTGCLNPNRVEVELTDFDPSKDAVLAELATLLQGTDVEVNTPDTAPGCMGSPTDPECSGPFERLGLPFGGAPESEQQLFHVLLGAGGGTPVPQPSPTPTPVSSFVWNLPAGFPRPFVPADNPMSEAKVQLGRHLFFDERLSLNETQSCSSCHAQERAFSDGQTVSTGSTGELTPRNAPSLTNVAYNPTLTWMSPHLVRLEDQTLVPLFGEEPVELGFSGREDVLLQRLRDEALYQQLFAEAFPGEADPISVGNVTKALASFERILISGSSPYDRYLQGDDTALSESARRGLNFFFSELLECDHCHGGLNFASSLTHDGNLNDPTPFENNGLYDIDGNGAYPEPNTGLFAFTGEPRDMGRMKPPTLRNIELTAPYMHDGSIATLEEVILHYERGGRLIEDGPNAGDGKASPFKSSFLTGFPLSPQGRADLIEFLKSLTDTGFTTDPRLSDPFANP